MARRLLFDGGLIELGQIPLEAPTSSTTGYITVWDGSAWVKKPVFVWTGSAWVQKPVSFWNGSTWQTTA